ncbi:hypothetical protein ASD67_12500 [Sphingopyxis sp. Root1497]|nr:hypothetical protein ASD67_12500 [Sphingopyxis sp. Root1497]
MNRGDFGIERSNLACIIFRFRAITSLFSSVECLQKSGHYAHIVKLVPIIFDLKRGEEIVAFST